MQLMEMYAERYFSPHGALLGVRAGRFRMPFGIYRRSDYGYSGFLREGVDSSIRVQGYRGQFIVGASYARSNPYLSPRFAVGRQAFSGVDVRWAHHAGVRHAASFYAPDCPGPVTLQLNYLRQHGDLPRIKAHSIDFSATYSFRIDR